MSGVRPGDGAKAEGSPVAQRRRAEERPTVLSTRLRPALRGLQRVLEGERFGKGCRLGEDRRFLGWSAGRHWALPDATPPADAAG